MGRRRIAEGRLPLYPLIRDGVGFVAAPRGLPIGTRVRVPGYHQSRPVQVLDRTATDAPDELEVFIASHAAALEWGVKKRIEVLVEMPAGETADDAASN